MEELQRLMLITITITNYELKIEPPNKRFHHRYDYRVKTKYSIPINNDFPLKAVSGSDNGKDILNFYFNDRRTYRSLLTIMGIRF